MALSLYYSEPSAAMGVRVLLEEIGVPYDLVWTDISSDSIRDPQLLALNPNGWIPILVWKEGAMYECGAITIFLCDQYPDIRLSPSTLDPKRATFLQWLFFFSSSLQNAYQMTFYSDRFCISINEEFSVKARSRSRLTELWEIVDVAIGDKSWMLGNEFSAVDLYLFMLTTWLSDEHKHPSIGTFPNVKRIADKVLQRPSVQTVYKAYISRIHGQIR
ncbi:MAG: glutathione S-transferase [Acidiferrobacteraceae bacterium]|nr:glutathione S-transferase [Acidiferrobacteraceae bacterium]|tara:strand:- start:62060 stop:62710 length:651 start_codon:yes stop_codon:yes gene_type:complete